MAKTGEQAISRQTGVVLIKPLRKRTLEGKLYQRDPKIEAKLIELAALPRQELAERCGIGRRDNPNYVPSECLLYFVRESRADNSDAHFEQLYKLLASRVRSCLPKAESADGRTESLTRGAIRDKVFGRFVELLSRDRREYFEKLDFFEIRFDAALKRLRLDAQEQAWRDENRSVALEFDEDTGEPSPEVERAAGSFDPFAEAEMDGSDYRSRLDAAIDTLPREQIRIIEMLRQGIPIDSQDAEAVTIAKALGKSEKTIRTHRDKAYAAIRAVLKRGEDL